MVATVRAILSILERRRMLDREPNHERDEEDPQDEERCCDDAKDESPSSLRCDLRVGLSLDRVQRLQPDHQRNGSAQGQQIAQHGIPPAIAMLTNRL
jgi:hypothetical protein